MFIDDSNPRMIEEKLVDLNGNSVLSRDGSGPFFWPRVGFRVLRSSSGRVSG